MNAHVFWYTGLSGSGKTTLTNLVLEKLKKLELKIKVLDGDDVRDSYPTKLGFSKEDIKINNHLISQMCKKLQPDFDVILVPIIAPFHEFRVDARNILAPNFSLIWIKTSLESVIQRDVKGLYQKAKDGIIKDMIGFSKAHPYETPYDSELTLETDSKLESAESLSEKFYNYIQSQI